MVTLVFSIAVALPMSLPFMLVAASGNQLHLSFPVLIGTFYIAIFGSVICGAPVFLWRPWAR